MTKHRAADKLYEEPNTMDEETLVILSRDSNAYPYHAVMGAPMKARTHQEVTLKKS